MPLMRNLLGGSGLLSQATEAMKKTRGQLPVTTSDPHKVTAADITTASVMQLNTDFRSALYDARTEGMTQVEKDTLQALVDKAQAFRQFYGGNYRPRHVAAAHWVPMLQNITAAQEQLAAAVVAAPPEQEFLAITMIPTLFAATPEADGSVDGAVDAGMTDVVNGDGMTPPADNGYVMPSDFQPGDISFYQQHKTKIWIAGGVGAALVIGGIVLYTRRED